MDQTSLTERLLQRDRVILVSLVAILFMLAALYTVFGVGMHMTALEMTAMRGMPGPAAGAQWSFGYTLLVFLMWWVMMIAMMLPSVSPTILLYSTLLRRGSESRHTAATSIIFLIGYLLCWAAFSLMTTVVQWGLETSRLVSANMMTLTHTVPGALVLIAAGIYQITPLKQACLSHCRTPVEFITKRRRPGAGGVFAMGLEHGAYCLGCCWFLMALLFVGGIMNLYWIAALAAFVTFEKLTPYGVLASKISSVSFVVWGGYELSAAL